MKDLILAAKTVAANAYAPYSDFRVGAAVLSGSGRIYTGCNVENASYGLTICAERSAIFKAVSEGERELAALAVFAKTDFPAPPCGACLQVMAEFGIEKVVMISSKGGQRVVTMSKLLPLAFTKNNLGDCSDND